MYNNTPYQITLPLALVGYCETNATILPINEEAYRVNNILQLLVICQSTILDEELSINNIIRNEKRNRLFHKNTIFQTDIQYNNLHKRTTKIFNNVQFLTLTNHTR